MQIFLHTFINFLLEKYELSRKIAKSIKFLELLKEYTGFFQNVPRNFFDFANCNQNQVILNLTVMNQDREHHVVMKGVL